jgi:hypothetical protein
MDKSRKTANTKAKPPYCSGLSHRASTMLITKFEPDTSPWSVSAKPAFAVQRAAFEALRGWVDPFPLAGPEWSSKVTVGFSTAVISVGVNPAGVNPVGIITLPRAGAPPPPLPARA